MLAIIRAKLISWKKKFYKPTTPEVAAIAQPKKVKVNQQHVLDVSDDLDKVDILVEYDAIYDTQSEERRIEARKSRLIKKIEHNVKELHHIAEQLFEKGFQTYYEKVIEMIEQSSSCSRILKRLDIHKPYSHRIMLTIGQQTRVVSKLIYNLYK